MNILDFGAKRGAFCGDAIQRAIDAAAAQGGGRVSVPAGEYETASLILRSNVELHLEAGAVLRFVDDFDAYPVVNIRWEGYEQPCHRPLVYAKNEVNVALTGLGTLEGQGQKWWTAFRAKTLSAARPCAVCFEDCTRVRMSDFVVRNSPSWTIHPVRCENVTIDKLTITNPFDSPNTDGIDPESCRNVRITGCHIDVGDDCIAVKAGTEDALENVPCENIAITGCTMVHGHGGVVLGSEMSGGIRRVSIAGCVFDGTDRGIRIKSRRGRGGAVEDVSVTGVVMNDVLCPLVVNLMYFCGKDGKLPIVSDPNAQPVTERTPHVRRIRMADIVVTNAKSAAACLYGLPEAPLEDISIVNTQIHLTEDAPSFPVMNAVQQPVTLAGLTAGHPVTLVMPEDAPAMRQESLLRLGAQIIHTPAQAGLAGARALAKATAAEKGWYYMDWLNNDDNPTYHRRVTGPALVRSIAREGSSIVDCIVIGVGSGGTITGVGETVKAWTNDVRIVAVEPYESQALSSGLTGSHGIPDIGFGLVPGNYNSYVVDNIAAVTTADSVRAAQRVLRTDAIPASPSAGAALHAAAQLIANGKSRSALAVFSARQNIL